MKNVPFSVALIVHGSKDPRWRQPFERVTNALKKECGEGSVFLAYMELGSPTLMEVAQQAIEDGKSRLYVVPFFMAAGGHVDHDIPKQVEGVKTAFPSLEVKQLPPIGEHPEIQNLMKTIMIRLIQTGTYITITL